jgi:hypothetical protein
MNRKVAMRAIRKALGGHLGENVLGGRIAPVADIGGEPLIQVGKRIHIHRTVLAPLSPLRILRGAPAGQQFAEHRMVRFRDSQQVRDDQQRKGLTVGRGKFSASVGGELVDQLVGEAPHELFVLLESLWSEKAVE